MKKFIPFFLLIAFVQVACYQRAPMQSWKLKTEDTYIKISILNNRPAIYELRNTKNNWNWIKNYSEMPLPENVKIGNTTVKPDWKYKGAALDNINSTKLTLGFFSKNPNLELTSVWEAKPGTGPIENSVSIKNNTGDSIKINYSDVVSANIKLTSDSSVTLWRFIKGRYLKRRDSLDVPAVKNKKLTSSDTISYFQSNDAMSGKLNEINGHLPFQIFDVNSRHGIYIGYEWSFGKFINHTDNDYLTVNYKAYLWDSLIIVSDKPKTAKEGELKIDKGKTIKIPAVFFGCYNGDIDDGSNKMKRWFWNYKITPTIKNNPAEPLIEYCIPGNEAELIEYYKKYPVAEWGAELGKIDIDWLDGAGTDWTKGDFKKYAFWKPDSAKWPNGMTAGDIVHSNKQKLSLYMNFTFEWNDIGTQAGRDKEKDALLTRYDKWHYDYWRSDMGLEKRFDYLSHEGLLEILDFMIANRPDFRYEHCANGGTLKDFTTLQRINVFTNEDSGGPTYHRESFYSCSYMINPVQIKTDIGMNLGPNGEVPKGTGFNKPGVINDSPEWVKYILRNGFMGANMATNWCTYTPNQIEGVKKHWPLYKTRQRPILRGAKVGDAPADVYHILPIPDGINWDGIEYLNTSLNKGSVLLFKPSDTVSTSKVIKFKGLNRKETYTITFEDRTGQNTKKTGAELMDKGILVKEMTGKWASEIIWIN